MLAKPDLMSLIASALDANLLSLIPFLRPCLYILLIEMSTS